MKRLLFSITMLCTPLAALALPSVGDTAYLNGNFAGKPSSERDTLLEYNAATKQFHKQVTVKVGDTDAKTQDAWINESDLPTDQASRDTIAGCAGRGGTPETIKVPAGTFDTCRFPSPNGGALNIGLVPFGVVKNHAVTSDGKVADFQLVSFTRGQ